MGRHQESKKQNMRPAYRRKPIIAHRIRGHSQQRTLIFHILFETISHSIPIYSIVFDILKNGYNHQLNQSIQIKAIAPMILSHSNPT